MSASAIQFIPQSGVPVSVDTYLVRNMDETLIVKHVGEYGWDGEIERVFLGPDGL